MCSRLLSSDMVPKDSWKEIPSQTKPSEENWIKKFLLQSAIEAGSNFPGLQGRIYQICLPNIQHSYDWLGPANISWKLGSFPEVLQCFHLDTPLLQEQNTNKYLRLKLTLCMHSWGKFWTPKRPPPPKKKKKKTQPPLWRARRKAVYWACPLPSTPPKRWEEHIRHPSDLTSLTHHYPHFKKGKSLAPSGNGWARELVSCSSHPLFY